MYTLKSIAQRGTMLGAAAALMVAAVVPAAPAFAAELNPLTERSLLLSSSAPGFMDTDGSGYRTGTSVQGGNPAQGGNIPDTYAPAGTGPNGKKAGQTFSFRTSSDDTVRAYSFQYCTLAAGLCQAPGNNLGDARSGATTARESNADAWGNSRSDLNVHGAFTQAAAATPVGGEFQITVGGQPTSASNWTLTATNREDDGFFQSDQDDSRLSGKNNYMVLRSTTGDAIPAGELVEITFKASENSYITNPGSGHFFVKINTYNDGSSTGQLPDTDANIIDGGVTVANVMTDSIHITTKVLETMAFSVGTRNRDTVTLNCGTDFGTGSQPEGCEANTGASHGTCDPIQQINNNRLDLGNPAAEFSLETRKAWDVYSYWRLSSNSSGGATVYYSGDTLSNTVGDQIADMTSEVQSLPGTEQFGLGYVDANADAKSADFTDLVTNNDRYKNPTSAPFKTLLAQASEDAASGYTDTAQPMSEDYDEAGGPIDNGSGGPGTAKFKFLRTSTDIPEPIAQQNERVISCATAKMRYVGNIGADTPAGVYTTKINYLAAPQY